jgi:hypothetical protein
MIADREVTNDCIAIAFYGVTANAAALGSFYKMLIEWFNSVKCPPDKLSVEGPGFSGKIVGFSRTHTRLQRQGFSGVTSIDVFATLPNGEIPVTDWWAKSYLNLQYKPCFVLAARRSVTSLEDDRLASLVKGCVSLLTPVYGIGYHRNHDKGPIWYAIGLNYSRTAEEAVRMSEETTAISWWGDRAMGKEVYREGFLRDVYPYNYLSQAHLTRRVGTESLQEWIGSEPSRCTLTRLDDRMTLWKVPSRRIDRLRKELRSTGVIFDWKTYPVDEEEKDPYIAAVTLLSIIPCTKCGRALDLADIRVPRGEDETQFLANTLRKRGWVITFERGITPVCPRCSSDDAPNQRA